MNLHHGCFVILLVLTTAIAGLAQSSTGNTTADPKEVRGYKVHRARVELKKTKESDKKKSDGKAQRSNSDEEYDEQEPLLIRLGEAKLISVSPFGVTFEVPVIVAAVKQQGNVDRLVFENMTVNDTPVTLDDYIQPFSLPNKKPYILNPPLRVFVSTPQAVLRTIDEIFNSKQVWQVTGRVYVCGHFKKYLFKFKRAVPVELQTSINNPLR
jgi:hypothetical protein